MTLVNSLYITLLLLFVLTIASGPLVLVYMYRMTFKNKYLILETSKA